MPFDPLPKTLSEIIAGGVSRPLTAVELGCGDGRLLALVRRPGVTCIGVDRMPRVAGSAADIVGDACRAPLREGSLDLLLAGNLVRHLVPARPDLGFLAGWLALLRPGGSLFILEDEPASRPGPAANHRDLQAFLARLWPTGRGPLLSRTAFLRRLPIRYQSLLADGGVGDNRWPQDADAAVAMLERGAPAPGDEAARLAAAIAAGGLACGRQWWCQLRVPGSSN
jgi:SAM-dependent methyltransferase